MNPREMKFSNLDSAFFDQCKVSKILDTEIELAAEKASKSRLETLKNEIESLNSNELNIRTTGYFYNKPKDSKSYSPGEEIVFGRHKIENMKLLTDKKEIHIERSGVYSVFICIVPSYVSGDVKLRMNVGLDYKTESLLPLFQNQESSKWFLTSLQENDIVSFSTDGYFSFDGDNCVSLQVVFMRISNTIV